MRVYNFSAGPATLALPVLQQAQADLVEHNGDGMSVMEMSHRSKPFEAIINEARELLIKLLDIPSNYKVLFLQGGASLQFSMVPLNLKKNGKADYINTGVWSKKAISEAKRYTDVKVAATSEDQTFNYIPAFEASSIRPDADYIHITSNNTIYGTKWNTVPQVGNIPVVSDMSSCILSEPIDVSKFGIIYAGAQKNIGPAGVTIVIIREDLIGNAVDFCPTMLNYQTQADNDSLYNTPPTFAIYMAMLGLKWLDDLGGVAAIQKINQQKAALLYDFLDSSKMFKGAARKEDRSLMNVTFVTDSEDLNAKFISEAKAAGLVNLKGHRSVGGMRASIYNPMPIEGVQALVDFMKQFEANN